MNICHQTDCNRIHNLLATDVDNKGEPSYISFSSDNKVSEFHSMTKNLDRMSIHFRTKTNKITRKINLINTPSPALKEFSSDAITLLHKFKENKHIIVSMHNCPRRKDKPIIPDNASPLTKTYGGCVTSRSKNRADSEKMINLSTKVESRKQNSHSNK